ncbi:MAG: glycosyltransferase family 2 protein [Lacunisphaera sp.]|nr:glycosyltransferase family 2 protein [Lacunisphaera sp.]
MPPPDKAHPLPAGLSVVVPVYNSAAILPQLVARLGPVLQATGWAPELILVNDGSRDDSWAVIQNLATLHPWVRGLSMMRNFGQHNALLCGVRSARFAVIVTLDDDLQNPPEEIPLLLEKLEAGYDVVYGAPKKRQHGPWRDLASMLTRLTLQPMIGAENARNVSSFRAFRTHLRTAFGQFHGPFVSLDVLLTWGTQRFASVPVMHDPRLSGASNYSFLKLASHALDMVTGFSTWPLRLASLVGLTFTAFGGLVLVYVVVSYIVHSGSLPGFPFLASIIAIFSGAQLFALGVFGEYLARIHFRSMNRPTYVVKAETHAR